MKVVCCVLKLVFVVCVFLSGMSVNAGDKPVMAFLPGTLENQSQAYAAKMFEKYGGDYGFEVVVLDSPGANAAVQAKNVEKCISDGVAAVAINPNDIITIVPALKKAKEAGMVVCLFSSDLPEKVASNRDIFVGVDDTVAGVVAAKAFINQFPDGAKIVEIGGQNGHDAQLKRTQGFHSLIDNSNIEVLATQNCKAWSTEDAQQAMSDLVTVFGDEIQGVFCHWDNGVTGVVKALEGSYVDNVFIVGVDGCSNGFKQILNGQQSITIAQNIKNIVNTLLERTQQKMNGEDVDAINFIEFETISKANINDYEMPEW